MNYESCPFYQEMDEDWKEGIKADGCIYPHYGLAPHKHTVTESGIVFAGTIILEKETWPTNFIEDKDCEGCGTWECPHDYICKKEIKN